MMERILVAVDDSPSGLAAGRVAVRMAPAYGAVVRVVHVLADAEVAYALEATGGPELSRRRASVAPALFAHVTGQAQTLGVEVETVELVGEPARLVLEQASLWGAELIVIGRGTERGVGGPYVGRQTRVVLEFAELPVLVVPEPRSAAVAGNWNTF